MLKRGRESPLNPQGHLYIQVGGGGNLLLAPCKYKIYRQTFRPSHEAHLQHGLGHSPNSSPSATLFWSVRQSIVAEYIGRGLVLFMILATRIILMITRSYTSLKTPSETQWDKTDGEKSTHAQWAYIYKTITFQLMINFGLNDDEDLRWS